MNVDSHGSRRDEAARRRHPRRVLSLASRLDSRAPETTHGHEDPSPPRHPRHPPRRSWKWQAVERIARETAALYALRRDPHARSSSTRNSSTAASARPATSSTRKPTPSTTAAADSITLRPEGTAGVVRAVIEHGLRRPGRRARQGLLHRPEFPLRAPADRPAPPAPPVRRRSLRRRRPRAGRRVHPAADGLLPPLRREGPRPADQQPRRRANPSSATATRSSRSSRPRRTSSAKTPSAA